jgi:Tol biopolymer transport system component
LILRLALFGALAVVTLARAAEPAPALEMDGVPPPDEAISKALEPYESFRSHGLLAWHPLERTMIVARRGEGGGEALLVKAPGADPVTLVSLPGDVDYATFEPRHAAFLIFARGGAQRRLYRQELTSREVSALSPEGERISGIAWSPTGDRIAYLTQNGTEPAVVRIVDPRHAASDRVLAHLDPGLWSQARVSSDGREIALVHGDGRAGRIWLLDAASGSRKALTRASGPRYSRPRYAPDGRSLFAVEARGARPAQLVQIDLANGRVRPVSRVTHAVKDYAVSGDAKRIALLTHEEGTDVLRFLDLATFKELPRPPLFSGSFTSLRWRPGSDEIAFVVASARSAGDVFSYQLGANQLTRWTNGNNPALNTNAFPEPRVLSNARGTALGLLYEPPADFPGRRPVLVEISSRPGATLESGFTGTDNYLVGEMGVALLRAVPRAGLGVEDVGALLEAIGKQPGLDPARTAFAGIGEGAAAALASARRYGKPAIVAVDARSLRPEEASRGIRDLRARRKPAWLIVSRNAGFEKGANRRALARAKVQFVRAALGAEPNKPPGAPPATQPKPAAVPR